VDGASKIQTFFTIVLPISLPAYASVGIIIFTQVWNEFFIGLTLVTPRTQTAQVAMAIDAGSTISPYNLQMAASLLTVAVPLMGFIFFGRYFVRGVLAGALKGSCPRHRIRDGPSARRESRVKYGIFLNAPEESRRISLQRGAKRRRGKNVQEWCRGSAAGHACVAQGGTRPRWREPHMKLSSVGKDRLEGF